MALQISVKGKQNFLPTLPVPTSAAKACAWVKRPDGTKDNCRGVWAPSECSTIAYVSANNVTVSHFLAVIREGMELQVGTISLLSSSMT